MPKQAFLRRFLRARSGGAALLTALALPPIVLISLGAVQLNAVFSDRALTQDTADAAALWGVQQLGVTAVGVEGRTNAYAQAQLAKVLETSTVTINTQLVNSSTIKVTIDTNRPSFFFNLFPTGGFNTHSESMAQRLAKAPLCVLVFGTTSADKGEITGDSKMIAPGCLVHVNERVEVSGAALLQAAAIQAGSGASGPMSPSADVGAPDNEDPFEDIDINGPLICLSILGKQQINTNYTMPAGAHCGEVEVQNGKVLTLAAGEHYFHKGLALKNSAQLSGDDVVLIFGQDAYVDLKEASNISLRGRKSGRLAGFVMATTRDRGNELKLDADSIHELTGTVYVPTATLNIDGTGQTADSSDWTVVAAKALKLSNKPEVQVHSDYAGSDVPVPIGAGPHTLGIQLVE